MHAYLVVGDLHNFIEKIDGVKREFPFNKIADVKELNSFTKLKLTEKTVILLKDFDKATNEAQNSFLKSLEEPQDNLTFVLTATNIDNVLSTIQSRCEIVEIPSSKPKISDEDREKVTKFIDASDTDKLKVISLINKRDEAIGFLDKVISVGHEKFLVNTNLKIMLDAAIKTKRGLEANGNVQLQLTNFVVNSRIF